jgi:protein-S-isoprenylcysteine O-methyltransferase Ste14
VIAASPKTGDPVSGAFRRRVLLPAGNFFFRYRDFLFPAVFLAVVLLSRPGLPFGPPWLDRALDAAGIALALAGQLLRALVIGLAYIRRGGLNKQVYAESLVTEGFFAHSRNPLYLGNFMALVGFCLIHNSLAGYLVAIPFFAFAYLAIVAAEEDYLGRRFGAEFDAYCRRVPRFLPRLAGLGETMAGMRFDFRRLVRKEYGSTFAGSTCILALLLWDEYARSGAGAARHLLPVVLAIWAPLVAGYLTARYLKKSGALGKG